MRVSASTAAPIDTPADTIAIGVFAGKGIAHDLEDGTLQVLVDDGEATSSVGALAVAHGAGRRWILVGLGDRDTFDAERARVVAAAVAGRARELRTRVLAWELPHKVGDDAPGALVEGTILASYRFDRFKAPPSEPRVDVEELIVSAHHDVAGGVETGRILAEAQNRVRDLANRPPNDLNPEALADRARELAATHAAITVEVEGREGIVARGMGAFAAVAQGSDAEPALITLRYEPATLDAEIGGPVLGLVGKAVTFDSGGISIKPAASMANMKFDMCGGGAVLEALGAIAELGLPLRVVAVVGATENMLSGHAMRPGDIVRTKAGLTVEINNTDAEGRLVLADCLAHALEQGAQRLVDVATLTGAILSALGHTHAGLIADDDAWAAELEAAGRATGELLWRLPLHPETAKLVEGVYADLTNAVEGRIAGSITAAEFLKRFTGDVPWAHLDIVGTAWDLGRPYAGKGSSGFGVRLLVELARASAAQ
ncbi:MAG: Leucyl aminopeptidase [Solirubrobacterales bacterium]|jgi:leucyl aminopeptidase|nr:Leucyl aminopeptidase [Solirubrobacterales bacterium]